MDIRKVIVIGAGQMGSGIAQTAAVTGLETVLHDVRLDIVERGIANIAKSLAKFVEKGKMTAEERDAALSRIRPSDNFENARDCDLAIEAVVENLAVKSTIFKSLDSVMPAHAILASNTSSLPITELAAFTGRPSQVIGMHFMNPVPIMKLVEIIRGLQTSDSTFEAIENLAKQMGKVPASCQDVPGFISNRVLQVMINEAIWCLYEGVATPESIDTIMKLGMNHPMGPLALADLIGLDTVLSILEVLQNGYGDPKYRPCPLLRQYVKAGWLGRKSGRGFYNYQ
ncbi:3-hydroxybutyryl-CoA dehydrogenase [Heliophilum fasciatum]|uniref:3-hydroxybutyryl-CoA dehydrogenase n=1 Tax=Heliophilum fasciatum TaxID=35700 RepID=A0A4R2RYQ9_9FIRM|nr:3-hydroxybutyryl-CoA dehydrogenase [Heliophilum fasciatum]MCW2276841.1 3-hydroxybutyryl-CoA dehydrogenase [Heliophilum fasciatum]TCP68698.1 3-hydroxybutyryl-CoA dehydrogenase [Heliophilum fasciatum]